MPAKRKTVNASEEEAISLQAILQDDGNSERDSYSSVDSVAIQRLIYCISSLGGMVTFWYDSNNSRLCFSMRLFGGQRSYQIDDATQFPAVSESVVSKLTPVMVSKKLSPPQPLKQAQKDEK